VLDVCFGSYGRGGEMLEVRVEWEGCEICGVVF